jgi:hypothetical protein
MALAVTKIICVWMAVGFALTVIEAITKGSPA